LKLSARYPQTLGRPQTRQEGLRGTFGGVSGSKWSARHLVEPVASADIPAPLSYKPGDENSKAFWRCFVEGDSDNRAVERECARKVCELVLLDVVAQVGAPVQGVGGRGGAFSVRDVTATRKETVSKQCLTHQQVEG
jgi:hypothetical protein